MVATLDNGIEKIEPINMTTKIGSISTTLLVDSGSACIILDTPLATRIAKSSLEAIWVSEMDKPQLRTLSNPIEAKSNIRTPVTSNGWLITDAELKVVAQEQIGKCSRGRTLTQKFKKHVQSSTGNGLYDFDYSGGMTIWLLHSTMISKKLN